MFTCWYLPLLTCIVRLASTTPRWTWFTCILLAEVSDGGQLFSLCVWLCNLCKRILNCAWAEDGHRSFRVVLWCLSHGAEVILQFSSSLMWLCCWCYEHCCRLRVLLLCCLTSVLLHGQWIPLSFEMQQHFRLLFFPKPTSQNPDVWVFLCQTHQLLSGLHFTHSRSDQVQQSHGQPVYTVYFTSKWSSFCIVAFASSSLERRKWGHFRRENKVRLTCLDW